MREREKKIYKMYSQRKRSRRRCEVKNYFPVFLFCCCFFTVLLCEENKILKEDFLRIIIQRRFQKYVFLFFKNKFIKLKNILSINDIYMLLE